MHDTLIISMLGALALLAVVAIYISLRGDPDASIHRAASHSIQPLGAVRPVRIGTPLLTTSTPGYRSIPVISGPCPGKLDHPGTLRVFFYPPGSPHEPVEHRIRADTTFAEFIELTGFQREPNAGITVRLVGLPLDWERIVPETEPETP